MKDENLTVRIRLDARAFLRVIERIIQRRLSRRRRPLLCRWGIHRWGPWDIRLHDWRTVERRCRGCHKREVMSMKVKVLDPVVRGDN